MSIFTLLVIIALLLAIGALIRPSWPLLPVAVLPDRSGPAGRSSAGVAPPLGDPERPQGTRPREPMRVLEALGGGRLSASAQDAEEKKGREACRSMISAWLASGRPHVPSAGLRLPDGVLKRYF